MKRLLQFSTKMFPLLHQTHQICFPSRVLASFFSTKILIHPPPPSSPYYMLYDRIQIIRDPGASVVPVLDQWLSEGNPVEKRLLQSLVYLLRGYKRFNQALEISYWMTDRRYFPLYPSDAAVRLELIHRVHGLAHAENYFENISSNIKTHRAYSALLLAYAREKSVQKAEAIMQKMKEKGMMTSAFPYNTLINLYSQTGDFDKINPLVHEMKGNGIPRDNYTMRNLMTAYVAESNISGMERILNQIEEDPELDLHWKVYSVAANGYLKVGQIEMALKMLKKMERMMATLQRKNIAFNFLLTHYANIGNKDELYRVWNTYKPASGVTSTSLTNMITSLSKVDDIEGAEKIFEEWESCCTMYDYRILNRLLVAYCRKGLFEKAESAIEKAMQRGTPYASTWHVMAVGYVEYNQMHKAVEMLKKAMVVARKGWRPFPITLAACLEFLEGQQDVEGMEEIITLLKKLELLTRDVYHRLLRTYIAAGKSVTDVLDRMKMDDFAVDDETHEILEARPC